MYLNIQVSGKKKALSLDEEELDLGSMTFCECDIQV